MTVSGVNYEVNMCMINLLLQPNNVINNFPMNENLLFTIKVTNKICAVKLIVQIAKDLNIIKAETEKVHENRRKDMKGCSRVEDYYN